MSRRCPRCGRAYAGSLKRYCSRCRIELVDAPPEEVQQEAAEPAPPPPVKELSMRARVEGALFALLLLCTGAVDLLYFAAGAEMPLLLILGVNGAAIAAGGALYMRERRRQRDAET